MDDGHHIMDLVDVDETQEQRVNLNLENHLEAPPEQQQSLKIQARIKSAKELYDEKSQAVLRLVGSQIVGYQKEPLKRNQITNTSDIWNIPDHSFSKYASNVLPQTVICETCVKDLNYKFAEINYGKGKSTSNVKNHLKSHHYDLYVKYVTKNTSKCEADILASYEPSSTFDKRDIRSFTIPTSSAWMIPLCRMIVNNYLPLSFVDDDDFRCYSWALNSKAKIPCATTLYEELVKRKAEMSVVIDKIVAGNDQAITTDSWTSVANENYTATTRHFIDQDWILRSLSLDCIKHVGSTKADDIAAGIEQRCYYRL